ncbi:MAG: hypothetical protein ACMG6S_05680 [Byssovorax sp.]
MSAPSPAQQSTAQRLIEEAARGDDEEVALVGATEHVFQGLHDHLAKLIGVVGFKTLLARALQLARADAPALAAVEVKPDGLIAGLSKALVGLRPTEALTAPATLLAHFLALLAAFLGEDLALHLVREAVRGNGPRGSAEDREDQESTPNPGSEER